MLLTIIGILGTLIPAILTNRGVIGEGTDTLITNLMGPISTLIGALRSGNTKTADFLAALAALSGVVAVLKATPGLPADALTEIGNVSNDITAALTAYATAGAGFDPTLYKPIAEVV